MAAQMEFLDSHNTIAYLIDPPEEHKSLFQSLIVGLNTCKIAHAIRENPTICESHVREFWANAQMDRRGNCITSMIQNKKIIVSEAVIRKALAFGDDPRYPTKLDRDKIEAVLSRMGYEGKCPPYLKKMVHPYWRLLIHVMQLCLLAKKCGQDELNQVHASALVSLAMGWDYNFSRMLFDDMKSYLMGKKDKFLMVPRFIQMILNVKYPALKKTVDTLDIKPMQSAVFGLMKQSRKSAKVSYQGLKPLEKFGNFPEIEGMEEVQAQAHSLSLDVQVEAEEEIEPLVDPRPARRRKLKDHRFLKTSSNIPPESSSRPADDSTSSSSTEYRAVQGKGKTKTIPIDVDVLQDKVFELERMNTNKEAMINELLETQSRQAAKIAYLEAQAGSLTALLMELKQQVTGKAVLPEEKEG